jgi:hypothetical protein
LLIPLSQLKKLNVYPRGVIHIGACYLEEAPIYQEWGVQNVLWIEANPKLTNFNLGKMLFCPDIAIIVMQYTIPIIKF